MRTRLGLATWLGALAIAACTSFPALAVSNKDQAEKKIKVLIIDGQNNHDWKATTPHMKKVLEACGRFSVDVATTPERPGSGGDQARYREAMEKFHPDLDKY